MVGCCSDSNRIIGEIRNKLQKNGIHNDNTILQVSKFKYIGSELEMKHLINQNKTDMAMQFNNIIQAKDIGRSNMQYGCRR